MLCVDQARRKIKFCRSSFLYNKVVSSNGESAVLKVVLPSGVPVPRRGSELVCDLRDLRREGMEEHMTTNTKSLAMATTATMTTKVVPTAIVKKN